MFVFSLRSLSEAHVPDPAASCAPTVAAAFVYSVKPPAARARNWYARDEVKIASPFEPSLHTKVPFCAALARAPAAKLYVPTAEFA